MAGKAYKMTFEKENDFDIILNLKVWNWDQTHSVELQKQISLPFFPNKGDSIKMDNEVFFVLRRTIDIKNRQVILYGEENTIFPRIDDAIDVREPEGWVSVE
jgi:hypothetical protein